MRAARLINLGLIKVVLRGLNTISADSIVSVIQFNDNHIMSLCDNLDTTILNLQGKEFSE